MRILLAGGGTGGHLMPAHALAQALIEARPDADPVLVGVQRGIEPQVLPNYPFRFHLLPVEPIHRHQWWRNARWLVILPGVWHAVGKLLRRERPAIVIGTGGYAAGPVVLRAQGAGIPTALQEQNALPGLTTRWLARRARQVHLGFPEARARLRIGKHTQVFTLGNPIRPPPAASLEPGDRAAALREFGLDPARPTLLVFGGSQGAREINYAVTGALERRLLADANVLWGTGIAHEAVFARYGAVGRVVVRGFLDPIALAYRAADLVVSRAGAMTVAELCAWGKPSVLVPLPSAAADHQTSNARALEAAGAALHIAERDLSPRVLASRVRELLSDRQRLESLAGCARARGNPNAAREVMSKILTLVETRRLDV